MIIESQDYFVQFFHVCIFSTYYSVIRLIEHYRLGCCGHILKLLSSEDAKVHDAKKMNKFLVGKKLVSL